MSADQCSYEYWLGPREVKYSSSGVERSVRPSATIRRARAVLDIIGVTKVADVTDLDRVGIMTAPSSPHPTTICEASTRASENGKATVIRCLQASIAIAAQSEAKLLLLKAETLLGRMLANAEYPDSLQDGVRRT